MTKAYYLIQVINHQGRILFNQQEVISGVINYYPFSVEFEGMGINAGANKKDAKTVKRGTPRTTPYTPQEIYNALKAEMGNTIAKGFKDLYKDLIDVDL